MHIAELLAELECEIRTLRIKIDFISEKIQSIKIFCLENNLNEKMHLQNSAKEEVKNSNMQQIKVANKHKKGRV
ncbi:hypothetical protein [Helicobacter turcicus]|uniref:Uncharacterized protein n=1 Tax=Helicobacter turcicus TaxID=2867412 RepID=A0ABS7JP99_9HELI|nr:hypothetical protein [Helicobacter turcicus]MBX7491238.1 hypothetical protein [Helicobacter turcicus]MBX7546123.1 hypothetical protein [Helicobacter turcicus]